MKSWRNINSFLYLLLLFPYTHFFFTFFQVFLKWSTVGWKTGCFCQTFHRNISTKSNLWAVLMPATTVVLPKIVLELSFQKRLSSLWHVSYFQKIYYYINTFKKKLNYRIEPNFSKDIIRPPLAIFSKFLIKSFFKSKWTGL